MRSGEEVFDLNGIVVLNDVTRITEQRCPRGFNGVAVADGEREQAHANAGWLDDGGTHVGNDSQDQYEKMANNGRNMRDALAMHSGSRMARPTA